MTDKQFKSVMRFFREIIKRIIEEKNCKNRDLLLKDLLDELNKIIES